MMAAPGQSASLPQTNPGGDAVAYNEPFQDLPENARPNDATISLYEERKVSLFKRRESQGRLYTIKPKGNAIEFAVQPNPPSQILEAELSKGYILSYLYFENGAIRYNGKATVGRFSRNVDDETLFSSASTGKSITSYIVGHAICEGYISSKDEVIDWPMMSKTLYQGQPLRNLLDMSAGDKHTVDERSSRVMGSRSHHRDMGLDSVAFLLEGVTKRSSEVFYNNFLADVIANYVVFKAGNGYDELMRRIFQDKVKIKHAVSYEKRATTLTNGVRSPYYGELQTQASYSYRMTRMDYLRLAEAMMLDYRNNTCVGQYLKESQSQAKLWPRYRPNVEDARFWMHSYSKKYGAQFYFDFHGMEHRNILGTEGLHGQNMLLDMDNSRILVVHGAATAWDQRVFLLNVIRDGQLPQ
jgi:CubicO group peptidase (beta-lactamase class C family)